MKSLSLSDPFTDVFPMFSVFYCYPFLMILPMIFRTVVDTDMCAFKIKFFLNSKSTT